MQLLTNQRIPTFIVKCIKIMIINYTFAYNNRKKNLHVHVLTRFYLKERFVNEIKKKKKHRKPI